SRQTGRRNCPSRVSARNARIWGALLPSTVKVMWPPFIVFDLGRCRWTKAIKTCCPPQTPRSYGKHRFIPRARPCPSRCLRGRHGTPSLRTCGSTRIPTLVSYVYDDLASVLEPTSLDGTVQ